MSNPLMQSMIIENETLESDVFENDSFENQVHSELFNHGNSFNKNQELNIPFKTTETVNPVYIYSYKGNDYKVIRLSYWKNQKQIEALCREAIQFEKGFKEKTRVIFVSLKDFDEFAISGLLKKIIETWGILHKADVIFAPVECVDKYVTSRNHKFNVFDYQDIVKDMIEEKCIKKINVGLKCANNEIVNLDDYSEEYELIELDSTSDNSEDCDITDENYENDNESSDHETYESTTEETDDENLHESEKLRKKHTKPFDLLQFLRDHVALPLAFIALGIMFQFQVHHEKLIFIFAMFIFTLILISIPILLKSYLAC